MKWKRVLNIYDRFSFRSCFSNADRAEKFDKEDDWIKL